MRILLIFLLFSFSCFGFPEVAQDSSENIQQEIDDASEAGPAPLQFDRDKIASLKEDPDFDYTEEVQQENWWTKFKRYVNHQWQALLNWLFGDYKTSSFVLFLLELIPYLIIIGIFIFILWLFIKLNPGSSFLSQPETGKVFLNEEEEIVQSKDIEKLIDEAISKGDFRLAVRFYYLLILQQLTEAGVIEYQFPKTNEEYLAEIRQEPLQKQFRQITRIYDFIWYGSFEVTEQNFRRAEKEFLKMQELIKRKDGQNL